MLWKRRRPPSSVATITLGSDSCRGWTRCTQMPSKKLRYSPTSKTLMLLRKYTTMKTDGNVLILHSIPSNCFMTTTYFRSPSRLLFRGLDLVKCIEDKPQKPLRINSLISIQFSFSKPRLICLSKNWNLNIIVSSKLARCNLIITGIIISIAKGANCEGTQIDIVCYCRLTVLCRSLTKYNIFRQWFSHSAAKAAGPLVPRCGATENVSQHHGRAGQTGLLQHRRLLHRQAELVTTPRF